MNKGYIFEKQRASRIYIIHLIPQDLTALKIENMYIGKLLRKKLNRTEILTRNYISRN